MPTATTSRVRSVKEISAVSPKRHGPLEPPRRRRPTNVPAAAPEIFRRAQPAGEDRTDRKNDQRQGHHRGRFMKMRLGMIIGAALAVKHHEQLAKHVKSRHARRDQADAPKSARAVAEGLPQNQILGEKTGRKRRSRRSRESRPRRSNKSWACMRLEPAHFAHVLLADSAWMTLPEPRNKQALKNAWVKT